MSLEVRYSAFEKAKNYTKQYELEKVDSIVTRQEDDMLGYISAGQFATTGSNIFEGGQIIDGNLTIVGDIFANTFNVTTSSVNHFTASTNFGLDGGDTHTFTGSVFITGSESLKGDLIVSGNVYISGTTELGGNIVPKTARGATLGTSERPFSDIFVSSGSINIASDTPGAPNTTLSNVNGNILVSAGGMRLVGNASFIAATGSFSYLSGSFTHIGAQFNEGDIITTGSLSVSGSTIMIGNNTMTGNTQLTGSVNISGSLNVNTHPVVLGQLSWARYDDTQYTTSSFLSVTVASGEVTLPNNGGYSVTTHLHSDIQFYNTGSQKVYAETEGDVYVMTVTFKAKTSKADTSYVRIQMDSAGSTPYRRVGKDLFFGKGNDVWHDYHEVFQFYADTDFVTNGNQWKIRANGATVDISNVIYFIQRTQNHLI